MRSSEVSRLRFLLITLPLLISLSTAFAVAFGPNPSLIYSPDLAEGVFGLNEVRDRIALASWWLITALMILVIHWNGQFLLKVGSWANRESRLRTRIVAISCILSPTLLAANYTLDLDRRYTDNWPRFQIHHLLVGVLLMILTLGVLRTSSKRVLRMSTFGGFALLVFGLAALFQSPGTIRDFGHFSFLSNELVAPVYGGPPLSGFISQYTTMLGIPLIGPTRWTQISLDVLVVNWLLLLQVVCFVIPITIVLRIGGRRALLPTVIIMFGLLLTGSTSKSLGSVTAYFSGFPTRTVIPSLLLMSLVGLRNRVDGKGGLRRAVIAGVLGGVALLNNPDFGGPALLAGLIVAFMTAPQYSRKLTSSAFLGGCVSTFLIFEVASRVFGEGPAWTSWLFFQRLFGVLGVDNETMAVGGLHVGFVVVFSSGTLIFFWLSSKLSASIEPRLLMAIRLLGFGSLWGLGTLPYFAGRSFTSTLFGHSYQLALVLLGLLAWYLADSIGFQQVFSKSMAGRTCLVLFLLPLLFVTASMVRLPNPGIVLENIRESSTSIPEVTALSRGVEEVLHLVPKEQESDVVQILLLSNFVESQTGVDSALVLSHPGNLFTSPIILSKQCAALREREISYVIEMNWDKSIADLDACASYFRFSVVEKTEGYLGVRLLSAIALD